MLSKGLPSASACTKKSWLGKGGVAILLVPWWLSSFMRVAVIDTGMVLVDDPLRLRDQFESKNAYSWFMGSVGQTLRSDLPSFLVQF